MELAYDRVGTGTPLILVHGLGGSRRIWEPVLERLTAERDVITVDLPGFGESPMLSDGIAPTAANLGGAVTELSHQLGLDRPHLAGNSLGAWVALEIAKAGEGASVCCLSPAGLWRKALGPRRYDLRGLGMRVKPILSLALRSRRLRRGLLQSTLARPENLTATEAKGLIYDWLGSPGYDAANSAMRMHVFEQPELVTVPTTIAWGAEDRLVAPPRPERMPPGTRYLVLEGCGHTPTWDDPGQVADLLLQASSGEGGERGAGADGL